MARAKTVHLRGWARTAACGADGGVAHTHEASRVTCAGCKRTNRYLDAKRIQCATMATDPRPAPIPTASIFGTCRVCVECGAGFAKAIRRVPGARSADVCPCGGRLASKPTPIHQAADALRADVARLKRELDAYRNGDWTTVHQGAAKS